MKEQRRRYARSRPTIWRVGESAFIMASRSIHAGARPRPIRHVQAIPSYVMQGLGSSSETPKPRPASQSTPST